MDVNNYRIMMLIIAGAIFFTGCAMFKPFVNVRIELPSKYYFSGVKRIAVLDFAGKMNYGQAGAALAENIRAVLSDDGQYVTVNPEQLRQAIKYNRISPSRFQELSTIRFIADHINAEALCFGDITTMEMSKEQRRKIKRRKIGEKSEKHLTIDAKGNTRVVLTYVPVYKTIEQNIIEREVDVEIRTRIIEVKSGDILWENDIFFNKKYFGIEDEEEGRRGYWMKDSQLYNVALKAAAKKLFKPLLKRPANRRRQLAAASVNDYYGQLIQKGNRQALAGHWKQAGQFWLKAFNAERARPEAIANLGIAREKNGEYQQAIKDYQYAGSLLGQPWLNYVYDIMNYRKTKIK